jgi:hypothetical protein
MANMNYFECPDSREATRFGEGYPLVVHSFTDMQKAGEAIKIVAGYFLTPGTIAYRLKQAYPSEAAREALETLAFLPTKGSKNLVKLFNFYNDIEKLKEVFGIAPNEGILVDFEADMSHGPNPINVVHYRLYSYEGGLEQGLLFRNYTGDETVPLHIGQIEEILDKAEESGFQVSRDGVQKAKQNAVSNYGEGEDRAQLMKHNMAYVAPKLAEELVARFLR